MTAPFVPLSTTAGSVTVEAGPLARNTWRRSAVNGGAMGALLAWAAERTPTLAPLRTSRATLELLRPVPLGRLHISANIVREGKQLQLIEAECVADGILCAVAIIQRCRVEDVPVDVAQTPPGRLPERAADLWADWSKHEGPFFFNELLEIRPDPLEPGRGWFRVTGDLVEGERNSDAMRAVVVADHGSALGPPADPLEIGFPNTDLTVHLVRPPTGEWLHLAATIQSGPVGIGVATSTISDPDGAVGVSTQTLFYHVR